MSAPDFGPRWTRRRWVLGVALLTVFQFGLVFWTSENRFPEQHPPPSRTKTMLDSNLLSSADSDPGAERSDPTLFALAHPRSFSRAAWLALRPFPYSMTNPPGLPEPLSIATEELVDEFGEFVQTNVFEDHGSGNGLPPVLSQPGLSTPVVVNASVLHVAGELRSRPWVSSRPLPQQSEPILTNTPTVVRVLVNAAGLPVSAALIATCGVAEADRDALDFSRSMRFARSGRISGGWTNQLQLASGYLTFRWHGVQWLEPGAATAQVQVTKAP